MSTEAEYAFLKSLPTHLFSTLVNEWNGISLDLTPNGILSDDNKDRILEIIKTLKHSKLNYLKKLSKYFEISDIWWEPYKLSKIKPLSGLQSYEKSFSVEKYYQEHIQRIKGKLSVIGLTEYALFILVRFSTKLPLFRRTFRYIFLPFAKTVLVEPQSLALNILKNEVLPMITKDPNDISFQKPTARLIKTLAKSTSDKQTATPIVLTYLKIRISLETSGIEGLNQITIQGDDVIRGAETLEQRHEISLKFMNSGPWIGAGTKDFKVEVGKGFQLKTLEMESLKNLSTVLTQS